MLSVAPTSPLAQLADELLDGALRANLKTWRASGASWDEIAKRLWLATDQRISITGPTAQSWTEALESENV